MENCPKEIQDLVISMIEWAGERMTQLNEEGHLHDLYSIYEEFYEWIEEPSRDTILVLDPQAPT